METGHEAATCRWATPTLFLPYPLWLNASDAPWACMRARTPRLLDTTDVCLECPVWEPREERRRPERRKA